MSAFSKWRCSEGALSTTAFAVCSNSAGTGLPALNSACVVAAAMGDWWLRGLDAHIARRRVAWGTACCATGLTVITAIGRSGQKFIAILDVPVEGVAIIHVGVERVADFFSGLAIAQRLFAIGCAVRCGKGVVGIADGIEHRKAEKATGLFLSCHGFGSVPINIKTSGVRA